MLTACVQVDQNTERLEFVKDYRPSYYAHKDQRSTVKKQTRMRGDEATENHLSQSRTVSVLSIIRSQKAEIKAYDRLDYEYAIGNGEKRHHLKASMVARYRAPKGWTKSLERQFLELSSFIKQGFLVFFLVP